MNISKNMINLGLAALIGPGGGYIIGNLTASEDTPASSETKPTASQQPAAADNHDEAASHSHDDEAAHEGADAHSHDTMEVTGNNPPGITNLTATKDPMSGWDISFDTTGNFEFAPDNASTTHVDGEGHAHLYVDGKKITRLYSGDYFLADLEPGEHEISVTLNSNTHMDYSVAGKIVSAKTTVTQP